jgi:hypothetical protein
MSPPVYQDNASVRNGEKLFRRVHVSLLVRDDDTGLARVSSGAFKDRDLSVHIESALSETGRLPESCLHNCNAHKLVSITSANAREFNQAVCRDPLPNDHSHGLVYGSKNSRRVYEGLRAAAKWVIPATAPRYEEIEAEKRALGIPG